MEETFGRAETTNYGRQGSAQSHRLVSAEITMSEFLCACNWTHRSACKGLPFYAEHEGERYCVLHFPGKDKEDEFQAAVDSKVQRHDFDFGGVFFSEGTGFFYSFDFDAEASFRDATFEWVAAFSGTFRKQASFQGATFTGVADLSDTVFEENVEFSRATFEAEVLYIDAIFRKHADFSAATFNGDAVFSRATFVGGVEFLGATFNKDANFNEAVFGPLAFFAGATFGGRTRFSGMPSFDYQTLVNFQHARVEYPDQLSFHTVALRPSWFIDVDTRRFNFTNAKWYGLPNGLGGSFDEEVQALQDLGIQSPHNQIAKVCRELSINAEENRLYAEAAELNYWAMDAQRKEHRGGTFAPWTLIWWYWALSGYGERHIRSALWLAGI